MPEPADALLVRSCALPVSAWRLWANPALHACADRLEREDEAWTAQASALADALGVALVPRDDVGTADRRVVLALRRRLHAGRPPTSDQLTRVTQLAAQHGPDGLAAALRAVGAGADRLGALAAQLEAAVPAETDRLTHVPALVAERYPFGRAVLAGVLDDGPTGGRSQRRQRERFVERSHQAVVRAVADPTPWGWKAHVACGLLGDATAGDPADGLRVARDVVTWTTDSLRAGLRQALADVRAGGLLGHETVALNPLTICRGEDVVSLRQDDGGGWAAVALRRTDDLEAVRSRLAALVCCTAGELASDVTGRIGWREEEVLAFVARLVDLGVVVLGFEPRTRRAVGAAGVAAGDGSARTDDPSAGTDDGSTGTRAPVWIDVHRTLEPAPPLVDDLRSSLAVVVPVLLDQPPPRPNVGAGEPTTWPVDELIGAAVDASVTTGAPARPTSDAPGGPPARVPGSALDRFLDRYGPWPRDQVQLDLDPQVLAAHEPTDAPAWPLDCLVSPTAPDAPYRFVLDEIWPAGRLDSRFAALGRSDAGRALRASYQQFLDAVEERSGVRFCEVLAPPLSDSADNAVRRPAYTQFWTGDPRRDLYVDRTEPRGTHVPFRELTVRSGRDGLSLHGRGQRFWAIGHATRMVQPPWDLLVAALLRTAPAPVPAAQTVGRPPVRLPGGYQPRVVVGSVVVRPRAWRLPGDELWDVDAPVPTKLRVLARLRRRYGLPARVTVAVATDPPRYRSCDLDSLPALRVLEHAAPGGPLVLSEWLPEREHVALSDPRHGPGDRSACELVVRLTRPADLPGLADRVVEAMRG